MTQATDAGLRTYRRGTVVITREQFVSMIGHPNSTLFGVCILKNGDVAVQLDDGDMPVVLEGETVPEIHL